MPTVYTIVLQSLPVVLQTVLALPQVCFFSLSDWEGSSCGVFSSPNMLVKGVFVTLSSAKEYPGREFDLLPHTLIA